MTDLVCEFEKTGKGEGMLRRDDFEGAPIDKFHDDERAFRVGIEVEDRDDVRVMQRGENGGFLPDGRLDFGILVNAFYRDVPTELLIPSLEYTPAATFPDGVLNDVAAIGTRIVFCHVAPSFQTMGGKANQFGESKSPKGQGWCLFYRPWPYAALLLCRQTGLGVRGIGDEFHQRA